MIKDHTKRFVLFVRSLFIFFVFIFCMSSTELRFFSTFQILFFYEEPLRKKNK